jgi:hypothetical protein
MKEYNWNNAPVICTLNGVKWLLGPETEEELTWGAAKDWCKSVGGGLPPRDVLLQAYLDEDIRKEFAYNYYWSSTENDSTSAWSQYFYNGFQDYGLKSFTLPVRAVRACDIGE